MTESRAAGLRKSSAERARGIRRAARIGSQFRLMGRACMPQLVIHSTLLRRQQQQQQTECFEHVSHSARRWGDRMATNNANRITRDLQLLSRRDNDPRMDGKRTAPCLTYSGYSGEKATMP
jgi:hypothetical protein